MEFANGALVTLGTSWDVHRNMEIYGTEGSLVIPDPNFLEESYSKFMMQI